MTAPQLAVSPKLAAWLASPLPSAKLVASCVVVELQNGALLPLPSASPAKQWVFGQLSPAVKLEVCVAFLKALGPAASAEQLAVFAELEAAVAEEG